MLEVPTACRKTEPLPPKFTKFTTDIWFLTPRSSPQRLLHRRSVVTLLRARRRRSQVAATLVELIAHKIQSAIRFYEWKEELEALLQFGVVFICRVICISLILCRLHPHSSSTFRINRSFGHVEALW